MRFNRTFKLRLGKRLISFRISFWNVEIHTRYGIENVTVDDKLIPFFDFKEGYELIDIAHELSLIQEAWGLSTIYIIQSYPRASFRAFCLDKCDFGELVSMLSGMKYIDFQYFRNLVNRRKSVLRIISKEGDQDRIITKLKESSVLRKKSFSHAIIFSKVYNLDWKELMDTQIIVEPIKIKLHKYESLR